MRAAPDVPVVVLSANRDAGMAIDTIRAGADAFMVKDVADADAVAHLVRGAADRSRQNRDGSAHLST